MQKIERLYVPQKTKNTEFLEGSPGEVAKKLVEKLRNEVRVPVAPLGTENSNLGTGFLRLETSYKIMA